MRVIASILAVGALLIAAPAFAQTSGGMTAAQDAAVRNTATHAAALKDAVGAKSDAAWSGTGDASEIAILKAQVAKQDAQLAALSNLLCKAAGAAPAQTAGAAVSPSCTAGGGALRVSLVANGADVDYSLPSQITGYAGTTGAYAAVSVTTTATAVFTLSATDHWRQMCNNSASVIYWGFDASVTTSNGMPLAANTCTSPSLVLFGGTIYAVVASSTADVRVARF